MENPENNSSKDSEIISLRSKIENEKRLVMYADSAQARISQLREITYMEARLKELESKN